MTLQAFISASLRVYLIHGMTKPGSPTNNLDIVSVWIDDKGSIVAFCVPRPKSWLPVADTTRRNGRGMELINRVSSFRQKGEVQALNWHRAASYPENGVRKRPVTQDFVTRWMLIVNDQQQAEWGECRVIEDATLRKITDRNVDVMNHPTSTTRSRLTAQLSGELPPHQHAGADTLDTARDRAPAASKIAKLQQVATVKEVPVTAVAA